MNVIYVAILSIVLLLGSFFIGGTYTLVPVASGSAVGTFVMNRFTGHVWLCNINTCRDIPNFQPQQQGGGG